MTRDSMMPKTILRWIKRTLMMIMTIISRTSLNACYNEVSAPVRWTSEHLFHHFYFLKNTSAGYRCVKHRAQFNGAMGLSWLPLLPATRPKRVGTGKPRSGKSSFSNRNPSTNN
jgi:hypothetical protein